MELWLTVEKYPEYEVSSHGRVKSKKNGAILKPFKTNSGYFQVKLWHDGRHHHVYIHRLVADTFYDGIHDNLEVNHINGDKLDNFVGNLEFCTRSENARHAIETGLFKPYQLPPYHGGAKKVMIVETGEIFNSITECAEHIGGYVSGVSACLRGKVHTHKGYHFEFVN